MFRSHIVYVLNSQSKFSRVASEDRRFNVSVLTHQVAAEQVKGLWEVCHSEEREVHVFPMCYTDVGVFRLQSLHKTGFKKS